MPYKISKSGSGYKVTSPNHPKGFSKKPLSKRKAKKQLAAIYANTNESYFDRQLRMALSEGADSGRVLAVKFRDPDDGYVDTLHTLDLHDPESDPEGFLQNVRADMRHPDYRHFEYWLELDERQYPVRQLHELVDQYWD